MTDTHIVKALSESAFKIINLRRLICNQNGLGIFPRGGKAPTPRSTWMSCPKVKRASRSDFTNLIFVNSHVLNLKLNWENAVVNSAA